MTYTCTSNGKLSRSSPKTITCGVPQGSILSPLLFLLCINDMPESLNYSTPSLYADDTEIYASSNDCVDLVPKVNNDLENIRKWMIKNKLQIHPSKSKHMFIACTYWSRFPLRKISIGLDRTGLFSSCIIRSTGPKKLKILQLFICGSQVQTGTENWYRKPMRGFNFVPIRTDPMLIFLSGNQPYNLKNKLSDSPILINRKVQI